ncbi:MAG: D-aminoacylase [Clostridia bacterium]|nr:D-aminoacylase [Clostridia bacterium]
MFDILIKNANIVDGSGKKGYQGDIAVKDAKIAAMGKVEGEAKQIIDATGLTATPGFIDSHSHGDGSVLEMPDMDNIVLQGVTTIIGGQCGGSDAPCGKCDAKNYEKRKTVKDWFDALEQSGLGSNVVLLAGHSTIRDMVMGDLANRAPTAEEMEQMKALMAKCMDEGAKGMNLGIYYTPGAYATTDEIVEIGKVVGERGGVISSHIRSESVRLVESVEEMIEIARRTGAKTVVSHHKAAGGPNYWGRTKITTKLIEEAREQGVPIWCDVYPYEACSTSLWATFISPERQALGKKKIAEMLKTPEYRKEAREWIEETFINHSWHEKGLSWCLMCGLNELSELNGLRINEAAEKYGKDEFETLFDVLAANECVGRGVLFTMNEEDVQNVISKPYAMIGSDGSVSRAPAHPRNYGTFPRAVSRFVRELKAVEFEEMIRKMTSLAAEVYDLDTKGLLEVGRDADICIIDADKYGPLSTFVEPGKPNVGVEYVLVNGVITVEHDKYNGALAGKPIRKA